MHGKETISSESLPTRSKQSSISGDPLKLDYSFGYDCKRLYNLCLADSDTLVFASGNFIHFFSISQHSTSVRRTVGGQGIGAILKNPNPSYNYLTVAENGQYPSIFFYSYPSMEVKHILNGGAERSYSCCIYSPDGELFVSQSGEPDYLITIWNWQKSSIILRTKSFSNNIMNVVFSAYIPGNISTGGLGHIKFWKMSDTFTGLKLQGELGRFGKTEICDIMGIFPLADENVLSGCDWGNILVWNDGLISREVCRKGRRHCHDGAITFLSMDNGEVMSVGMDGFVRTWFWETVDLADPPDDDRFVEIEPICEFEIGDSSEQTGRSELRSFIKCDPSNKNDYFWYGQDGNGGIWLCDISPHTFVHKPKRLFRCHAGSVIAVTASPHSTHLASLGVDGRLHIYDYASKMLLFHKQFPAKGTDMIWFPLKIDRTGAVIALAFDDGVIRTVRIVITAEHSEKGIQIIQAIKSHSQAVNQISVNPRQTILVSGSMDRTIFVHYLSPEDPHVLLRPIGLINVPSAVTALTWIPETPSTILIGCMEGEILETNLPERPRSFTDISYNLKHIQPNQLKFVRNICHPTKIIANADDGQTDELVDSLQESKIDQVKTQEGLNRIIWLRATLDNTVWISMAGSDAGYIYEHQFGNDEPMVCIHVPDSEGLEIHSFIQIEDYMIFGISNGTIRVTKLKEDRRDLSDYWSHNMHDNLNGNINSICQSYDRKFVFSAGSDGNIFMFAWLLTEPFHKEIGVNEMLKSFSMTNDIDDPDYLSLEEQKQKDDLDRRTRIANERKNKVLAVIAEHKDQFARIAKRNKDMPESQQLSAAELELDNRITNDFQDSLDMQMDLLKRIHAFDVEKAKLSVDKMRQFFLEPLEHPQYQIFGISKSTLYIKSFRIKTLGDRFYAAKRQLEDEIRNDLERRRIINVVDDSKSISEDIQLQRIESFLCGLTESTLKFRLQTKMSRLLKKYRTRKSRETARAKEWEHINAQKPDTNLNHPDDELTLKKAENSIGDYKLKNDLYLTYSDENCDSMLKKYAEVLEARQRIFELRYNYNNELLKQRNRKIALVKYVEARQVNLINIHQEIPEDKRRNIYKIPEINEIQECPEKWFEVYLEMKQFDKSNSQNDNDNVVDSEMLNEKRDKKLDNLYCSIYKTISADVTSAATASIESIAAVFQKGRGVKPKLSLWEVEMHKMRLATKLFDQDQLIADIDDRLRHFDAELQDLIEHRLQVAVEAKFLDLHLLALNQELLVLRDFKKLENKKLDTIDEVILKRGAVQTEMTQFCDLVSDNQSTIDYLSNKEKDLQLEFTTSCAESKFSKFLGQVFNRIPRSSKTNADAELSGSISSDDDAYDVMSSKSLVSEMGLTDHEVCPNGCDEKLFNLTIELRNARQKVKEQRKEQRKLMKFNQTKIDEFTTIIAAVDENLKSEESELDLLKREKQHLLNQIDAVIILDMDQLQYFNNKDEFRKMEGILLFDKNNITKLYDRVGQLAQENLEAKKNHRINVVHLDRMKTDCLYMERKISELKEEINESMQKKFGMIVKLDELEEAILRRFVYELRTNVDDIKESYDRKISGQKTLLGVRQSELVQTLQEGTEKLNILTVLLEEYNYLTELNSQEDEHTRKSSKTEVDYSKDLTKLREICGTQREQIEALEREIRTLSLKSKPLQSLNLNTGRFLSAQKRIENDDPNFEDVHCVFADPMTTTWISPIDVTLLNRIAQHLSKFLLRVTTADPKTVSISKIAHKIGKQFLNYASNIDQDSKKDFLESAVMNFRSAMPKKLASMISVEEIRNEVESVCKTFFSDDPDANPKEVIASIIESTIDDVTAENSQEITILVLREMITTLPVSDLMSADIIAYLSMSLCRIDKFNAKCLSFAQIGDELLQHCRQNFVDELNFKSIKNILRLLADSLKTIITGSVKSRSRF